MGRSGWRPGPEAYRCPLSGIGRALQHARFSIPGEPVPAKRHRMKGRQAYPHPANVAYARQVWVAWHEAGRPAFPADTALVIAAIFWLPRPRTHYRTDKHAHLLRDDAPAHPISPNSGDTDNFGKLLVDSLQGHAFPNDSQIVGWSPALKRYADDCEPHADVEIWQAVHP